MEVFEAETDSLIAAMEKERLLAADRERISRELHDGTIQSIYAAGLLLEDGMETMSEDPELARKTLLVAMDRLNETIGQIRRYIYDLHGPEEPREVGAGLRRLIQEMHFDDQLTVKLTTCDSENSPLPNPEQCRHVLSIAREALTNVRRHAQAHQVQIKLDRSPERLYLHIQDDGIGFDPARFTEGHGLISMQQRAMLLGGMLTIEPAHPKGTRVTLQVPLDEKEGRSNASSATAIS
ncbi:MAG TPA: sensor histidine kinase [Anaerolineae bacterium]|nr:sensor histidine kinase [Anaerolineae bacterium]